MPSAQGGNTNHGNTAMRFFDEKNRKDILSLINGEETRENFGELLSYFNKILIVTQRTEQTKKVNIQQLKQLGIELMACYRNYFPWAYMSPSVHQMAAHAWELFEINNGKSISMWSECPVEAWNKHIRAFKSGPACRTRQMSIKYAIQDTFTRMLIMTHPNIAGSKRVLFCSKCQEVGHTARKCNKKSQNVPTEERQAIENFFI